VDWRFLLRQTEEPTSICVGPDRLVRGLGLVSAAVPRDGAEAKDVDLVALVNPGRRSLRAAWVALRPGGELYAEWYLPPFGLARVRRRLAATGFTDVRCYWPWPWPSRGAQFWLPLGASNAIDFFLQLGPEARPSRLRRLLRALWRRARRLGVIAPLCIVARKPDGESGDIEGLMRERWEGWQFGSRPERLSWLLLTGGRRSVNKVVGLVFADSEQAPRSVVKFARTEAEEDQLRREAAALQSLRASRPELAGVPTMLFLGQRCGRLCLGESAVAGKPLMLRLDRVSFSELAGLITRWLVDLAGAPHAQRQAAWSSHLVEEPLREFEASFAGLIEKDDLARTSDLLSSLGDLPLVFEHRDFSPWNVVLNDEGEIAVLDWESCEPEGLPALDLIYFLTYAAFFVDDALESGRTREVYARSRDVRTATGSVVDRCERSYCERLGLDHALLRPLRVLCWIIHSRSEYNRLELDIAGRPDRETLRSSLFLGLWKEELRHAR